jgi:mannose-6-phosphate isomerase
VPLPGVIAIEGVVRDYAWGSATAIPELMGIDPDGSPVAELWLGAHPDDPAPVPEHDTTLDKLIHSDPGVLGDTVISHFGPRLPFLVKLLAAGQALSIQVHPTIEQAQAGFDAEDDAGIPRDAPNRNYRDANHKPELICALTRFEALCGFRPVNRSLEIIDALGVAELGAVREKLAGRDGLRAAFVHLLTLADPAPIVSAVVAAAGSVAPDSPAAGAARAVTLTASDFPGDVGVVLALLLNHVVLEPWEAIYLPAGNVHAYLRGLGVEIMANSDNVLRCGLTPKHVDVEELVKITDFTELAEPRFAPGSSEFEVPVPDFALYAHDLDAAGGSIVTGWPEKPYLVLCTTGAARVEAGGDAVDLLPGQAAFVPARDTAFRITGHGHAFTASDGVPRAR